MWKGCTFPKESTVLWSTLRNPACARRVRRTRDSDCLVLLRHLPVTFEDTNKKTCQGRKQYNTGSVCAPVKDHTTLGKVCTSPSQFKSTTLRLGQWHFCSEKLGFLPFSWQRLVLEWQPYTSDVNQVFVSLTALSWWQEKMQFSGCVFNVSTFSSSKLKHFVCACC